MKTRWGSGGIALRIPNLGNEWWASRPHRFTSG